MDHRASGRSTPVSQRGRGLSGLVGEPRASQPSQRRSRHHAGRLRPAGERHAIAKRHAIAERHAKMGQSVR